MSREFPDWVNPRKAAEGNRIFSGTIPLNRLSRLQPLLSGTEGEVGFTASFDLDDQKRVVITLEVEAELPLTCQATLEVYPHQVRRKSLLGVVEDPAEQELLPGHYEPTCTEAGKLGFAGIVEDELLLAIPQVPRKPGLENVAYSTDPDAPERPPERREGHNRPFAELDKLMRDGREGQDTE